ncbi:family 16 glycosylhydrolase [Hymenobacter nivis]|uniref:Glycoside hydrolase family 16 protein n=1 Tax=Hymenobacter nivis TaxID=1850093 RepID=A0A502GVY9_9BACT|nr:glycoside hydrolase family 16 protein [Hymenobacter nivis]TPG66429.1 glycoside hydrolase family 16 protein [Hymenobacter nivis]
MKNFLSRRHLFRASFALALGLGACTENKSAPAPTPVTPTPATPVTPTPAAANAEARDYAQYTELMWSDEFDGAAIDATKWGYDLGSNNGWGNNELEYYTNSTENAALSGGNLVIQAKKQSQGGREYTSARMLTKGKQDFKFGRVDVRAKLPKGQGIWPAIWMLGSDIDQNNWPKCGEIDIMELRGQAPNKILSTMHYPDATGAHKYKGIEPVTLPNNASFADDFHVFSVVRSQDKMRFFLDGTLYYTFTSSDASIYPFNNPFFLVLNVAVGGDFLGNPDATTVFPQQMTVDYVRYYQYK